MKVLHLGKFYPPAKGGIETILKLVCDQTSGEVHNTVLVANHAPGRANDTDGQTRIARLPVLIKVGAVACSPSLPLRLARETADIVVLHEPNPMALVAYFLARPAGRLVVWFHSEVIRPSWQFRLFYRPFLQFALSRASRIIVASPTLADTSPHLREWQSKCVVIPYGVEAAQDGPDIEQRAAAIRSTCQQPVVLFVGRLVAYKGVDVLIDATRGLEAVVFVVGEGPQRAALVDRAAAAGVGDRCRFLGEVSNEELAALYRACDVFVLPSVTRQEAFGVVQIEAMMRGKPVVSTELGTGTAWVNQHNETGLVVPARNARALHDALAALLKDPERRNALGAAGARRARSVFAVDRMAAAVLSLYRTVLGKDARQAVA